jgi:hypothetical protein
MLIVAQGGYPDEDASPSERVEGILKEMEEY